MTRKKTTGQVLLLAPAIILAAAAPGCAADEAEPKAAKQGFGFPSMAKFMPQLPGQGKKLELSSAAPDRSKLTKGEVVVSAEQKPSGRRWVKGSIHIKAQPHKVWETVHEERKSDPDLSYSKVLEEGHNHLTLEQKFNLIPVIGTAVCVMKNTEVPNERIDYSMVKSDRFKAMEGSWVLTPTEDGGTILELSSYIDMGLPVPRNVIETVTAKKIERRLQNVRKMAEVAKGHTVAERPSTNVH